MGTTLATYYAKLHDMPDSEYKVEILEDGPIKKIAVNGKIYEVDYNMGGDSIHSIIIDHHSHGVQISPSSNNSYTIMNKGELYQIELQGEMENLIVRIIEETSDRFKQAPTMRRHDGRGHCVKLYRYPAHVLGLLYLLCAHNIVAKKNIVDRLLKSAGNLKHDNV